jgi:hypothetical protein
MGDAAARRSEAIAITGGSWTGCLVDQVRPGCGNERAGSIRQDQGQMENARASGVTENLQPRARQRMARPNDPDA